jgi:hypothetical protein
MINVDLPSDLGHPRDADRVGLIVGATVGAVALTACLSGLAYAWLTL